MREPFTAPPILHNVPLPVCTAESKPTKRFLHPRKCMRVWMTSWHLPLASMRCPERGAVCRVPQPASS
eukprot:3298566-Rhodomonas_salina.1